MDYFSILRILVVVLWWRWWLHPAYWQRKNKLFSGMQLHNGHNLIDMYSVNVNCYTLHTGKAYAGQVYARRYALYLTPLNITSDPFSILQWVQSSHCTSLRGRGGRGRGARGGRGGEEAGRGGIKGEERTGGAPLLSDPPGFLRHAPSSHCASPQRPAECERRPGTSLDVRTLSAAFATPPGGPAGTQRHLPSVLPGGAAGPDLAPTPGFPPIKSQVTSENLHPELLAWKQTNKDNLEPFKYINYDSEILHLYSCGWSNCS